MEHIAATTGATAQVASLDETMTARELAQGYYDHLASTQAQPFTPSRLGGMRWLKPMFNISTFKSRDSQWGQGGQTWPDDDPRWIILNKQMGNRLSYNNRLLESGRFRSFRNPNAAARVGSAIFLLGHELGHNLTTPQYNFNEGSADYYSRLHFKENAATLGYNPQQIRRMWRANDKFNYVKEAPQ